MSSSFSESFTCIDIQRVTVRRYHTLRYIVVLIVRILLLWKRKVCERMWGFSGFFEAPKVSCYARFSENTEY